MLSKYQNKRFRLFNYFILTFLLFSFVLRIVFYFWAIHEADTSLIALAKTLFIGTFYDIGTISFFAIPYALYLTVCPNKLVGSIGDKAITYFALVIGLLIFLFSFFAEITFWNEFQRRFNFIAVDYLIYTYEVVKNINESYPIPLLVGGIVVLTAIILFIYKKLQVFKATFSTKITWIQKATISVVVLMIALFFTIFIKNDSAEWSKNRYNNELSKAGIYSFFNAFRSNELDFKTFYQSRKDIDAFDMVRNQFPAESSYLGDSHSILRKITNNDSLKIKPNVIFICVESLSASFLRTFGGKENIAPTLDSLANNSLLFTNFYA
ncbi:MAG: sulfatase-like hydrolase/transferase, partial [Bacteroidaceae bacterium]